MCCANKTHNCGCLFAVDSLLTSRHCCKQASELEALVSKALVAALAEEQYTRGVVVDGLNSQYLSPDLAANLLLTSLGLQKTCKPVLLP